MFEQKGAAYMSVIMEHVFCFTVVYSVVRPADDSENLKIVEFKKLSPHRESIRCLISVAGLSMS